jgi:dienelactone hydrolase
VREGGLVGTLYCPDGGDRLPGVLLLGGAEGGMHEDDAALLAANGYVALALAYCGMPGLPVTQQEIPLEYFGDALAFLSRHRRVRPGRLAVLGASKGGEAALLVGATFPQARAVISVVGSGLVTQGISQDALSGSLLDVLRTPVANWTLKGRALPYLPNVATPELEAVVAAGEPVALRLAFDPGLRRADLLAEATIPVERIRGAVLLISSDDDQGYGMAFHEVAAEQLATHHHPYTWRHIVYQDAGHHIAAPPYAPTTRAFSPGPGVTFRGGGTPEGDARARVGAWQETLRFLADEIDDGLSAEPADLTPGASSLRLLDHPLDYPDDPTGPVGSRLDRRPVPPEQARSVWSRPVRRRAPGYGSGGWGFESLAAR